MEFVTYDLGYSIMPNGDVVTSDGLPRGAFPEKDWPELFGKPLTFRKPTAFEQGDIDRTNRALASSLAAFVARGVA